MEILSTGEKIKRSRIYKGITLKELCGDKISISKMSCIENGKVKADKEIIEYIADKIGVDFNYLVQDVYEQVINNLTLIKKCTSRDKEFEENIRHNLAYAIDYKYYDVAFELIHIMFSYYLEEHKYENIQLIISQYYDLYQRTNTEENTIIYFRDMAKYLFQNGEYTESIAYYSRLRENILENKIKNEALYASLAYNEGICYCRLHKEERAYELLSESVKYSDSIKDNFSKGMIFQAYALVCIRLRHKDAEEYIAKAYEYQKDNPIQVAMAKGEYGEAYFEAGENDRAIGEIMEGIKIFPPHNKQKYVQFLNECIEVLYNNKQYEKAYELSDEALDLSIETDDIKLIERAYYFKGSILQKEGKHQEAEMYMNISLDSLFKFGSKEERYNRYLDMANMYYNLGDYKESIKYFTLAMSMEEQI
ncbi:transcriptional regulator [Clostridium paraputrificum]|uniref:transcriptional regulator n=1 Tax=Clostridium TaxID=1485 RepID=UPI003D33821A